MKGSPKVDAITFVLKFERDPLSPKEIAFKTGLNHSTVRVLCRRMLRNEILKQPWPGVYVTNPTYGVGGVLAGIESQGPPRVHNLRLRWRAPWIKKSAKETCDFDKCRIIMTIGRKRKLATANIAADEYPLDLAAVSIAVELWRIKVAHYLNRLPPHEDIDVSSVEIGWDYQRIRLDGLNCVTVQSFLGELERFYNRELGLRSEVKAANLSLDSLYALLKGGVTAYNIMQATFATQRQVSRMNEILLEHNKVLVRLERLFQAFFERLDRSRGSVLDHG